MRNTAIRRATSIGSMCAARRTPWFRWARWSALKQVTGPDTIYRYNRYRAIDILGQASPGHSSGEAAAAMEQVAKQSLPPGYGYEWTGTVYQQKLAEGKEGYTFGLAAALVFLLLAALYESWSIPFAVLLAVPLGIFGALLARSSAPVRLRHLHSDRRGDADRTRREKRHSDCRVCEGEAR